MKKKMSALLLCMVFVLSLAACGGKDSESGEKNAKGFEPRTLHMTLVGVSDQAVDVHMANLFAEKVAELTDGAVEVKIYPSTQLSSGNSQRGIEMMTQGTLDLAIYSNAAMAPVVGQELFALAIPFNYENYDAIKEMYETTGNDYVSSVFAKNDLKYLGYCHNGFRHFGSNKHIIETPEDMKGFKIRVMEGKLYLDIFKELGSDPVVMAWGEVYTALQQKTINGQDNGWMTAYSAKLNEVQPFYTESNYTYDAFYLMANQKLFDKLPENVQDVIVEAADYATKANQEWVENEELIIKEAFVDYGVQVHSLTEEQRAEFKKLLEPVIEKYKKLYGEEACRGFGIE